MSTVEKSPPKKARRQSTSQEPLRTYHRDETGTYLVKEDSKQKKSKCKIASHAIQILEVQFVISSQRVGVRYRLQICHGNRAIPFDMSHEELNDEQLFLNAVPPGFALCPVTRAFSLLRECLMMDFTAAEFSAAVTVLGWYSWQGRPVYVHAGGVISSDDAKRLEFANASAGTPQLSGLVDIDRVCSDVPILGPCNRCIKKICFKGPEQLEKYRFPVSMSREDARDAVSSVFKLLELGDPFVTYIAIPLLFAAAIRDPRFALFLYGETGSLKTAFALLLLSFFMPDAGESDCASFKSTENALRARFNATGNVTVAVDDYTQTPGTGRSGGEEARKAENFIRSVVNGTGKDRSFGDGSLRPHDRPRGLPLITGEQLPDGLASLRQRMVNLPVDAETFSVATAGGRPNQFDALQAVAKRGDLAQAMGAFIAWASMRLGELFDHLDAQCDEDLDASSVHRRLADAIHVIRAGSKFLLRFAIDVGACTEEAAEIHFGRTCDAIDELVGQARLESIESHPTEAFGESIRAALASQRCHIEVEHLEDYVESSNAIPMELLGYTEQTILAKSRSMSDETETTQATEGTADDLIPKSVFRPNGKRIGWLSWECLDLIPEAALAEANSLMEKSGGHKFPDKKTFGKLLRNASWIESQTKDRNTFKVRRGTVVYDVWRIHAFRLFEVALDWGEFNVETYKDLTEAEKRVLRASKFENARQKMKFRLSERQVDMLLNPHLVPHDRKQLLVPDPIAAPPDPTNGRRWIPGCLPGETLPGYGEIGDGLLA